MMFQHILVPLDGSQRAERALPIAAHLARTTHGSLILVRAVTIATEYWPLMPVQPALVDTAIEANLEDAKSYLAEIAVSPLLQDIPVDTIVQFGPAAATILETASAQAADLIILCSHGYTGMRLALMGSVAENVVHHTTIPVLLLRESGPNFAGSHPPLRILVGLDGSTYAKTAIPPAAMLIAALADPAPGAIHLTRVIKPADYDQAGNLRQCLEDAVLKNRQYLCKTVENIHDEFEAFSVAELGLQITSSVAVSSNVAETLIRIAENGEDTEDTGIVGGCDIIALSTHGYSGLQRWAMGSITELVLKNSKLPVLIIHSQKIMDNKAQSVAHASVVPAHG